MEKLLMAFALSCSLACSGVQSKDDEFTDPEANLIQVDVAVSDLKPEDEEVLETEIAKIDGVYNIRRDPLGESTVFTFEFEGDFDGLRKQIEAIEYPGLRRQGVIARLQYSGFDNRAPVIDVISPNTDQVITDTNVEFVVEVRDSDVASVTVAETAAKESKPSIFQAAVELPEGKQEVEIVAVDEAGNETREKLTLDIDTTPPELEATVKVVVEGTVDRGSTVYVDGREASVGLTGNWRIELPVKKGQKTVEVVAIDENGNKRIEQKPIGL